MYTGPVEHTEEQQWVMDETENRMFFRTLRYVPALYKIFDEILVNAADNKQRDKATDTIKVIIDEKKGQISVWNNGQGVEVLRHAEHNCWVPELIFGHLLSGSNFDDDVKRTWGGRFGMGAKLTNIFSLLFILETLDSENGKWYKQIWTDNMSKHTAPEMKDVKDKSPFTKITFKPDFARFGMKGLEPDIVALMKRRVYDLAGTCAPGTRVFLNGERLKINGFKDYVALFVESNAPKVYELSNEKWQVCVSTSSSKFQQVSFVNGLDTHLGGTHVDQISKDIGNILLEKITKKHKGLPVTRSNVKNRLFLFINSLIVNPSFDSQLKHRLKSPKTTWGSKCEFGEKFRKQLLACGIVDAVVSDATSSAHLKMEKKDAKENKTKRKGRISIPKLDDANDAGTKRGHLCTLILTEGDSAKALAMAGLSVVGRDRYGVFPLKGKPLNVRGATFAQLEKNQEIKHLKQIIGLKHNEKYEDTKGLRYGRVMIMADQDHDGSHIKALIINMFAHCWPTLFHMPGFLCEFITPIVKVSKGKRTISFYTLPEYYAWKARNNNGRGWKIKYYKGLGTSDSKEGKEYFSDLDRHQITFAYKDKEDDKLFDMCFGKKESEKRKKWILACKENEYLKQESVGKITYKDFVEKEFVLFSAANCRRAIPSFVDGLKPSQRKVLFGCFKRNLWTEELKVGSLAGYIIDKAAYHHGEASLQDAIVKMAQDFVGSNNINLLFPGGQFGTRAAGGDDSASARYIHTRLTAIARAIFHPDDELILNFLNDDGQPVEPDFYLPVIPMILVNGVRGVGTGWSTYVPNYNPLEIIAHLRWMLYDGTPPELHPQFHQKFVGDGKPPDLHPWYRGFQGKIEKIDGKKSYNCRGRLEKITNNGIQLKITELPIEVWTNDYKDFLDAELKAGNIRDFSAHHTDDDVSFTISLDEEQLKKLEATKDGGLEKAFGLIKKISISNMVLFNEKGLAHKYESATEILQAFFRFRLTKYEARKEAVLKKLNGELLRLSNRARFILAVIHDEIKIRNVPKQDVLLQLEKAGYDLMPNEKKKKKETEQEEEDNDKEEETLSKKQKHMKELSKGYDYLLSMPMYSLTKEKVDELKKQQEKKSHEIKTLTDTTVKQLWLTDLDDLTRALEAWERGRADELEECKRKHPKKKSANSRKRDKPANASSKKEKSDKKMKT